MAEEDSLALVAIYNATGGPTWETNWLTGPVSTWGGVFIEAGRVVELVLGASGLSRSIPLELSRLTDLKSLSMAANQFTGPIRRCCGALISSGTNRMSGEFRTEILRRAPLGRKLIPWSAVTMMSDESYSPVSLSLCQSLPSRVSTNPICSRCL